MLQYSFYREEKSRPFFLRIDFEPELVVVSSYLFQVSGQDTYEWILNGVNDVLSGALNDIDRDTEWFGAHITYHNTTFSVIIDGGDKDINVIDTKDFKEILIAWWHEKKKFDQWKHTLNY